MRRTLLASLLVLLAIPANHRDQMCEELLRILLAHRREFLVALPDECFEARRLYTRLEHGSRRWVLERITR